MTDRAWKAFERRCARDVGTERIPVTGERHGADAEDGTCCYQFKLGRSQPSYLRAWLAGIVAAGAARRPGKVGVVVWKPKGARDGDALVLLRWSDWLALHRSAEVAPVAGAEVAPDTLAAPSKRSQAFPLAMCAREGCSSPLPAVVRHGSPRRYCSPRCRRLEWAAKHPRHTELAA